jgi:hypothetical protein
MAAPAVTVWPTVTDSPVTVPSLCAVSGCSIFIASSTTITSPADTCWPSSAAIFTIVPCIGLTRSSPVAAAGARRRAPRVAGAPGTARRCVPNPAGSTTDSRFPPTSTVTVSRSPAGAASPASSASSNEGISAENSVSIHRVCTPKESEANAGSRTTAWWNGSTVGIPPTVNSASARAERSSACEREAPVTISLAISESNAPGTVIPAVYPASTRTPGPAGAVNEVRNPGAGRNPRPGSSALIRNSTECPRATGSEYPSASPSAMRNISRTRSMPVTSSLTGCSTCSRVFTSRNEIVPSCPTRNSQVPAPTYPAAPRMSFDAWYNSAV